MNQDNEDFRSGYRGGQFHHGMDRAAFSEGQAQKELENTMWKMAGGREYPVPGPAFTLLLVSPFLFTIYPVLGITIYVVTGGAAALMYFMPMELHWKFLIGFPILVFSFFPGYNFERFASRFRLYRGIRSLWRFLIFFVMPVGVYFRENLHSALPQAVVDASAQSLVGWLVLALIGAFVISLSDKLYFASPAEIEKAEELAREGKKPERGKIRRVFYSVLWIIPVVIGCNLLVRLVLAVLVQDPADIAAFYAQYSPLVYAFDLTVWLILCLSGKLPGTGKQQKVWVGPGKD